MTTQDSFNNNRKLSITISNIAEVVLKAV